MSLPGTKNRRRVFLMRHGEVDYRGLDGKLVNPKMVTLTENGQGQARAAAAMLTGVEIDKAVCSGLPRTRMTAELVLNGRGPARRSTPNCCLGRTSRSWTAPTAGHGSRAAATAMSAMFPAARSAPKDRPSPIGWRPCAASSFPGPT